MALRMGIVCAGGLIALPVTVHGASSYSVSHAPASVAALRIAQSYAAYGAMGGYAEQANTPLVGIGIEPFTGTMWLGTLYLSDQIAARMAAETATAMQSAGYIPAACGTSNSDCQAFDLTWTDSRNEA
jgi:hypothetical protein